MHLEQDDDTLPQSLEKTNVNHLFTYIKHLSRHWWSVNAKCNLSVSCSLLGDSLRQPLRRQLQLVLKAFIFYCVNIPDSCHSCAQAEALQKIKPHTQTNWPATFLASTYPHTLSCLIFRDMSVMEIESAIAGDWRRETGSVSLFTNETTTSKGIIETRKNSSCPEFLNCTVVCSMLTVYSAQQARKTIKLFNLEAA